VSPSGRGSARVHQPQSRLHRPVIDPVDRAPVKLRQGSISVNNLDRTISCGQQVYKWAKKYKVPIAFGTDLWGTEARKSQVREFEMRMELDSPAGIIRSATTTNAALLLQKDKLGTIAPGAYADLLVVEGDPLTDLRVMLDPRNNPKLIMKDGVIYKNEPS